MKWYQRYNLIKRICDLETRVKNLEPKQDRIGFDISPYDADKAQVDWDDSTKVWPMHWEED